MTPVTDILGAALASLALLSTASTAFDDELSGVVTVERGPFEVTLDLHGVFDESDPRVIAYNPEVFTGEVRLAEARSPGAVEKGQILVRLHAEALDEKVREAELDLAASGNHVLRSKEQARTAGEALEIRLLQSKMQLAVAQRALDEQDTIGFPQRLEQSEDRVKNWEIQRKESELEFQVLVGMYEADEVIEPAERLSIEQRQRSLDRNLLGHPYVIARHDVLKRVTIPRERAALELAVRKAKHARDLLQATSSTQVAQSNHELAQAELALKRKQKTLSALRRDRDALTIVAPIEGHAIAGHYRGEWLALDETAPRPGSLVSSGQVLFTIVQSAPKAVRAAIPEAMLYQMRAGQEATLVPTSTEGVSLRAEVTRIAPYSIDGRFEIWLEARTRHRRLYPGSTCRVRIQVSSNSDALTVPANAIRRRGAQAVVDVWKDGTAVSRPVSVGLTCGGRTEILDGLLAGEKLLTAKSGR